MEIPMIDWLSVTLDIANYDLKLYHTIEKLQQYKNNAVELRSKYIQDKVCYDIGGQTFEVKPNGTAGHAFILHNEDYELRFAKFRSNNKENYPIFVHFKSKILWQKGPEIVWNWFTDWLNKNIGEIKGDKLSRVDLCCHTDSIKFKDSDLERFKGRYKKDEVHRANRKFTGFGLGSRGSETVFCRIYDKSQEVKDKRDKLWFFEVWNNKGMDPLKVWNIEFELHRDVLKEMKIKTCRELFDNLKPLWNYLTKEWLVMTDSKSKRMDRCKPTKEWKIVQCSFNSLRGEGYITREKQTECQIYPLVTAAMGYVTSYSAMVGITDPREGMLALLSEGTENFKNRGKSFKEEVRQKQKLRGLGI